MVKKAQMKIQQMAFMIVAVFFFFVLVGLFFLMWQSRSLQQNSANLEQEQAVESLETIANMPELNCDSSESWCVDEDKLKVMTNKSGYSDFWPVESVKVYKIYPKPDVEYVIYDSNPGKEYSAYVSICRKMREFGYVYDKCEIGKLVVGVEE